MERKWEPYDPQWLVELAKERLPDQPWLQTMLARCTRCFCEPSVTYFVEYDEPNSRFNVWKQFLLERREGGIVHISILEDMRVGAIEVL
jgi:hypothetical protein